LEAILISHPQVADAGVVGIPHPTAGELPMAWVVLKSGATVTTKELDEFVSGNKNTTVSVKCFLTYFSRFLLPYI